MTTEGGFRVPAVARWPGKIPAGTVENGILSGMAWSPTFVAAAGNPDIAAELRACLKSRASDRDGASDRDVLH